MDPSDTIKESDYVIVKRNKYYKIHQVTSSTQIMLGKLKVDISPIIGKPYWSMFKMVHKRKMEYVLEVCTALEEKLSDVIMKDLTSGVDNRAIVNDNKSQLLSTDEITGMRDEGIPSADILTALVENSTTFKTKTEFSQEKYLKKKEKKYEENVLILRPTLRLVSEIMFTRDQQKMQGLRHDTLSQIISSVNIQPNGIYLLFENGTQGLIAAALLNYCSTNCTIINMSTGINPQKQAVLNMNFPPEVLKCMLNVKLGAVVDILNDSDASSNENDQGSQETEESRKRPSSSSDLENVPAKKSRFAEQLEQATNILKTQLADGFIISAKEYPFALVRFFDAFVKASRNLVVYSVYREPLVQLYNELKGMGNYVNIHLTETFYRQYQVLPDRTHPLVTMTPSGGFLLTATTVL